MTQRIYLSSPDVGDAEANAVARALSSGWVAPLGPEVDAFERDLAHLSSRDHCVALSSGTAALHLALLAVGVCPGDVVVTATMTFAATANAIKYVGAEPVFVDADDDGLVNTELVDLAITEQEASGRRVAAILPVDLLGKVAHHAELSAIARAHGDLPVISDAAESLGARRDGRPAGSYGRIATYSFNGNKIITTSGGGALLTDDPEIAERVRYLATQARQPVLHYEHKEVGYNYRLSNILASLGRSQLARLPEMAARRRQWRLGYRSLFENVPGVRIFGDPDGTPDRMTQDNCWLTSVIIDPEHAGFDRNDLIQALAEAAIESRPLWKPMHLQPVFSEAQRYIDGTSQRLFETGASLPSGSAISDSQMDEIHSTLCAFLKRYL